MVCSARTANKSVVFALTSSMLAAVACDSKPTTSNSPAVSFASPLAVTPLVPAVLFARILKRVRRAKQPLGSLVVLLPVMLPLLVAWAAGEARGALSHAGRATDA